MAFIKALARGLLITVSLVAINVSAQVSFVEGLTPLEGVIISKSASSAPAPEFKLEMPSHKAELLYKADYPPKSQKLGEEGKVLVAVLIGADGVPQKVELQTSSGVQRLDKAGMDAVMRWRYEPGKIDGIAEAMWFIQPVMFKLIEKENEK